MIPHHSKYDVKTFTNPGECSKGPSSTHSVTSNHSGSGNKSGPKFLFEMKIQWKKFFSWNENFYHWKKCFSMIPHPNNNININ